MNEKSFVRESDKMHTEKYKGNVLQFHLPMYMYILTIEIVILPTKCIVVNTENAIRKVVPVSALHRQVLTYLPEVE